MRIVGCDVGGTFTDLVLVDEIAGKVQLAKVLTTIENQADGVLNAISSTGTEVSDIDVIVHGTTTTTNALLEKKIARCGLITTKGFRDVLELGRRTRPNSYGMTGYFEPLIPREYRLEVAGRMDAAGNEITPLDEDSVREAAKILSGLGCEGLVIHFLHAYANPEHERRARDIAATLWHNNYVTIGSEILSEFREYERGTAAAVNASVQPVLDKYLGRLSNELNKRGYEQDLLVMQGNGGTVSSKIVADSAINTVMSGPASGVMAAAYTGTKSGFFNIITYDMGGTSSDVGLIRDGVPSASSELQLEYGMPIHVPMVDVHTIGAGGGSIAFINEAGILQVGPKSSGADPGPVCYGRGGIEPTITDANLILGRLNPEALLAVGSPVTMEYVRDQIEEKVGKSLGLDAEQAASAIVQIANNRMAGAIRMVSLARGHDPRDFALFAFGGAGPLHAAALAAELAIPKLLIPARPGITNAIGCAVADVRHDFVNTVNIPVADLDISRVRSIIKKQISDGESTIQREGIDIEDLIYVHDAEMQFQGQSHMLRVSLSGPNISREELQSVFEEAYFDRFDLRLPEVRAILVTLHTAVIGRRPDVSLDALIDPAIRAEGFEKCIKDYRRVWFSEGWGETPVLEREALPENIRFDGPAVIEQLDTTIIIEPGNSAVVDSIGNLLVDVPPVFRE